MSIGNVVSSIWRPTAPLTPSTAQKPGAPAPPPTPPQATQTTSLSGPTDPFQQLSADIQAKLLQLQATGSDTTQASTASGKAAKPHHHAHGTDPDADGSLVPTGATPGATTTAGAAPAAGTNPADTSMIDAMRQAIQAYAASASSGSASLTAPLATA
ncbi:MAG: hypothetical protein P4L90_13780 [Rhodopila sp.]|nr:hypothetical protein [Rhodopila sp.]